MLIIYVEIVHTNLYNFLVGLWLRIYDLQLFCTTSHACGLRQKPCDHKNYSWRRHAVERKSNPIGNRLYYNL